MISRYERCGKTVGFKVFNNALNESTLKRHKLPPLILNGFQIYDIVLVICEKKKVLAFQNDLVCFIAQLFQKL